MVTPQGFLTELEKEWVKADPMERHTITLGYASLMESREDAIRKETYITGGIETLTEGIEL